MNLGSFSIQLQYPAEEWDALVAANPPGTRVSGHVVDCPMYGVWVKLDDLTEIPALLEIFYFRIRAFDPTHRISFPEDYPEIGEQLEARILAWPEEPGEVRLTQLNHLSQLQPSDQSDS